MERLFRDRMEYLSGPRDEGCFLCIQPEGDAADDEAHLVLDRSASSFIILNKFPYNTGHLMIVPYAHLGDLEELPPGVLAEMMEQVRRSVSVLKEAMQPHAFNLGANMGEAAGAGAPGHFHFHVVPRWGGDTNFMPVLAGTKVLPELLEHTYNRLKPLFRRRGQSTASRSTPRPEELG